VALQRAEMENKRWMAKMENKRWVASDRMAHEIRFCRL
jgi:hypothetical protein